MAEKPFIYHFCPSPGTLGGVWTYIRLIMESELSACYRFEGFSLPRATQGVQPRLILQLARKFRELKPDILHIHGLSTTAFHAAAAARLAHCPRVLLAIHVFIEDSHMRKSWKKSLVRDFLEPYTLRNADVVYNVSAFGAAKPAMTHFARRNLGVIDNAMPITPPVVPDSALRVSFGFKPDDVVALSIGRADVEKGWHLLQDAMLLLDQRGIQQPKLLLVGDGPHRTMIEEKMATLIKKGRVVMPGRRNDVAELNAVSDFFVSPTLRDYQAYVFLEAMMQCKAILTTRVGGNPEIVVDGVTGKLIPPGDAGALAQGLEWFAQNPALCGQYGQAGRVRLEHHFAMPRLAAQLGTVYQDMLTQLPGVTK